MPSIDDNNQSPYQFKQYFREWLDKFIRDTFNKGDVLVFVTYQPPQPEWSAKKVIEYTQQLFGGIKQVTVIEQTFEKSNMYNYADYIDGYHSHLIMTESDYISIKQSLKEHDIVAKVIYDIEGLKYYLSKQAGNNYNRTLPSLNIPIPKHTPVEQKTTLESLKYAVITVFSAVPVYHHVINVVRTIKSFIIKNDVKNRFIDDT